MSCKTGKGGGGGGKLQTLVYDILPLEEGAEKRRSECGVGVAIPNATVTTRMVPRLWVCEQSCDFVPHS